MIRSIAVLLLGVMLLAGCDRATDDGPIHPPPPGSLAGVNCSRIPPEFQSFEQYVSGRPYPISGYERNVVKIDDEGRIWWNEVELTSQHGAYPLLETYLDLVPQFEPPPLTFLDFEAGAPCSVINEVRAMMMKHLQCGRKAECLQGDGRI